MHTKKLSYGRGTARRTTSVETVSTADELYDKIAFDGLSNGTMANVLK